VLVTGGVGVNPLMSILGHLTDENAGGAGDTSESESEHGVHVLC